MFPPTTAAFSGPELYRMLIEGIESAVGVGGGGVGAGLVSFCCGLLVAGGFEAGAVAVSSVVSGLLHWVNTRTSIMPMITEEKIVFFII